MGKIFDFLRSNDVTMTSLFRSKSKKLPISDPDPTYKVKYLGNVATTMMKGDGCVDKPVNILWANYLKRPTPPIDMKLMINASGLKVYTKEQGLTEYSAHRISYCCADKNYSRLFVWVYRHEGKKMKVELRCHAVLCSSDTKSTQIAQQLNDKIQTALSDFLREKTRSQNSRLTIQRTQSLKAARSEHDLDLEGNVGSVMGLPLRKKLLSPGQNYRPPVERSASAPKLLSIYEDGEEDECDIDPDFHNIRLDPPIDECDEHVEFDRGSLENNFLSDDTVGAEYDDIEATNKFAEFQIHDPEIDDDVKPRLHDDEDGGSAESGFSEPKIQNNNSAMTMNSMSGT